MMKHRLLFTYAMGGWVAAACPTSEAFAQARVPPPSRPATMSSLPVDDSSALPGDDHAGVNVNERAATLGRTSWACDGGVPLGANVTVVQPAPDAEGNEQSHSTPFATAIATLTGSGPRFIYVRHGTYKIAESVILTAAESGLSIVGCPGEKPVLEISPQIPGLIVQESHDVTISGLAFMGAASTSVVLNGGRNCAITANVFENAGVAVLLDHAQDNRIDSNLILDAESTGIELRDGSDTNVVADNIVDGADAPETHGGGIFLHGTSGNFVTHNLVQRTAGFGIGVANWDTATINVGNVITYNMLYDTAMSAHDSGGIYILGRSDIDTEMVIAGNVVDRVGSTDQHSVGIYLDDSTNGALVTHNVVRGVGSDAVQIHGGHDNRVANNLLDLGSGRPSAVLFQAAPADTNPSNIQTGNIVTRNVIMSLNEDPRLFVWLDGGDSRIVRNFYVLPAGVRPSVSPPLTEIAPVTGDSILSGDHWSDGYAAVQRAAAAAIGFEPIETRAAGVRLRQGAQ